MRRRAQQQPAGALAVLGDARRVRAVLRALAERGDASHDIRRDALAEINRVLGRSAGTRRLELQGDGSFVRAFVPVGDAFAGLLIPIVESAADALILARARARAPLRRSALRPRLSGRDEERPPPLVRHGDLRQPREGGAAPDEAASVSRGASTFRHRRCDRVEVVRTHLEMRDIGTLRRSRAAE